MSNDIGLISTLINNLRDKVEWSPKINLNNYLYEI